MIGGCQPMKKFALYPCQMGLLLFHWFRTDDRVA